MGNNLKSCCTQPNNEARGMQKSMMTFSSELDKVSDQSRVFDYTTNKVGHKNSINAKTTRRLSDA